MNGKDVLSSAKSRRTSNSRPACEKELKQQISELERCYQKALSLRSNLTGKVTLKISIDSKGKVSKVTLVSTQLNDRELEQCILDGIKGLNFLSSEIKNKTTVTLILNFKSS